MCLRYLGSNNIRIYSWWCLGGSFIPQCTRTCQISMWIIRLLSVPKCLHRLLFGRNPPLIPLFVWYLQVTVHLFYIINTSMPTHIPRVLQLPWWCFEDEKACYVRFGQYCLTENILRNSNHWQFRLHDVCLLTLLIG